MRTTPDVRTIRRRRAAALGLAVAGLLSAGACSKSDQTSTGGSTTTTAAKGSTGSTAGGSTGTTAKGSTGSTTAAKDLSSMMDGVTLISDGTITACSDIPYAPFEFEGDDGELTGFDVQLVEAMAESLGVKSEFKTTPFDGIIPALAADSCDIIASATTITDERKEKVDFTEPYFDADQSLLIRKSDAGTYKTLADLADKTIGVQDGTTGADYAEEHKPSGATIKSFGTADDMFAAIASGDVDALLQDFPVNAYRAVKDPEKFSVTEKFATGEQYGFAVKKDNTELTEALDAALAAAKSDGSYDEIYATWFGDEK